MQTNNIARQSVIEFAPGPQGMQFVAAVRFRRSRVELVKAPGWERESNLNVAPNITWWWYDVEMTPEAVLDGAWDLGHVVNLQCRHYLATAPDTIWVAVIAKDASGKNKWLKDYALRDGKIFDPILKESVGPEADLRQIIAAYRRQNGLEPRLP